MALGYPFSIQSSPAFGETDPEVVVHLGPTYTNDATGEKAVKPDYGNPQTMKLSEASAFLVTAMAEGVTLKEITPVPPPTMPEIVPQK